MSEQLPLMPGCDFVELYKVLKVQGWVGSGSDAKLVISEGMVEVNDELETRKRRKLVAGDRVSFNGEMVTIAPPQQGAKPKAQSKSSAPKKRARPSIEF